MNKTAARLQYIRTTKLSLSMYSLVPQNQWYYFEQEKQIFLQGSLVYWATQMLWQNCIWYCGVLKIKKKVKIKKNRAFINHPVCWKQFPTVWMWAAHIQHLPGHAWGSDMQLQSEQILPSPLQQHTTILQARLPIAWGRHSDRKTC